MDKAGQMPRLSARRQSTAILTAIASLVIGAFLLRFLRTNSDAQKRHEVTKSEVAATRHRAGEIEARDPQRLRTLFARIEDNFATGYQTMTAIIQGVALVVLVTTSAHAVFGSAPGSELAAAASQAVAVLVIIIVTTDQIFQLTSATRWLPSTIDTAIPYLVGIGEAIAALSLGDNTRWWGAIAWSLAAGALAFGNSAVRASQAGFEGIEQYYRRFVRDVRRSRDICVVLSACAVALAVASAVAHLSPWLYVAAPWAVTAVAVARVSQVRWGGVSAGDA